MAATSSAGALSGCIQGRWAGLKASGSFRKQFHAWMHFDMSNVTVMSWPRYSLRFMVILRFAELSCSLARVCPLTRCVCAQPIVTACTG